MLISKFSNNDVIKKIVDIEREHNIILPNQYKDFLCKYNGGYTPKTKLKRYLRTYVDFMGLEMIN